jgi:hypothetical protein
VTIPSQRRYVGYYASLVQEKLNYHPVRLLVKEIHLEPMPTFNGGQACKFSEVPYFPVDNARVIYTKTLIKRKKTTVRVIQ